MSGIFGLGRYGDQSGSGVARVRAAVNGFLGRVPVGIKVTGSNGKGSTTALIASVLRAHGLRVGVFVSPHLVRVEERIVVDGVPARDGLVGYRFDEHLRVARRLLDGVCRGGEFGRFYSAFEALTVAAAHAFAVHRPDVVVWEAGIGGALDPTRVMPGEVGVLTQVSLQHTALLGGTLSAIARDKARIIDRGVLVVAEQVVPHLREVAHARVVVADAVAGPGLDGAAQRSNSQCAVAAVRVFLEERGWAWRPNAALEGLAGVSIPGRMQRLGAFVLDVAHDPSAISALCQVLSAQQAAGGAAPVLVFGASTDRPAGDMLRLLAPHCSDIVLTRAAHKGTCPEQLAGVCPAPAVTCPDLDKALEVAERLAAARATEVLVTGGLFLVGEVLARLTGAPRPTWV